MRPQRTLFDAKTPWLSHGTPCTRQIGGAQSIITQNQKNRCFAIVAARQLPE